MTRRQRIWQILALTDPYESATRRVNLFLIVLILLNVLAVILGSVTSFDQTYGVWLDRFEVFSVTIFSLEYGARVWSCICDPRYVRPVAGRLRFMLTPMALIDLLAILPSFLTYFTIDMRFIRVLRLLRLARVAKLGRYSDALRLMGRVLRDRREELVITVLLMGLLVVVASSFIYFAETEAQPDKFPDIPSAMWWSIVTLTTVGYGDVFPITIAGKLFAALVAVFGVGMVALPTGILGAAFVEELRRRSEATPVCPHCGKELR